jgi:hypothetical protein
VNISSHLGHLSLIPGETVRLGHLLPVPVHHETSKVPVFVKDTPLLIFFVNFRHRYSEDFDCLDIAPDGKV